MKYSNQKNHQTSIQESDTSSIFLYHDYYSEDQSSLFDIQKNNNKLLKLQQSFNRPESSNNSLNKYFVSSKYSISKSNDINANSASSTSSAKLLNSKQLTFGDFDESYLVI